jgi:hypothetical protein
LSEVVTHSNQIDCSATFSSDGLHRFELAWISRDNPRALVVWLLNPTKDDHRRLGSALAEMLSYAVEKGYGGIRVINAFSVIAPSAKALRSNRELLRPENDRAIRRVLEEAKEQGSHVICGWGDAGGPRQRELLEIAYDIGVRLFAFSLTGKGAPYYVGRRCNDWEPHLLEEREGKLFLSETPM